MVEEQGNLNQMLLQNTNQTILYNAQKEFSKQLEQLGGNEDLQNVGEYFFEEGYRRLSSANEYIMKDLIEVLSHTFGTLVDSFKSFIEFENTRNDNLSIQIGQLVRFYNLIVTLMKSDPSSSDTINIISNSSEIKDYIFSNKPYWNPKHEGWSKEFRYIEHQKNGYETYYASGLVEIIRTISNKKRHPRAFTKEFNTEFNFHDDFHQIIGVYNLALYSFIELIEAWVSIKPFIDEHRDDIIGR